MILIFLVIDFIKKKKKIIIINFSKKEIKNTTVTFTVNMTDYKISLLDLVHYSAGLSPILPSHFIDCPIKQNSPLFARPSIASWLYIAN